MTFEVKGVNIVKQYLQVAVKQLELIYIIFIFSKEGKIPPQQTSLVTTGESCYI